MLVSSPTECTLSQPIRLVTCLTSDVLNRICKMGMSVINEKMFNIAERILNTMLSTRYFL